MKHAIDGLEFLAQFALCGEVMAFKLGRIGQGCYRSQAE